MSTPSIDHGSYAVDGVPLPAQNITAEQAALGSCMLNEHAVLTVVEKLKSHHFYRPAHQMIYAAILELFDRGEPVDAITVTASLDPHALMTMGGAPYVHTLIQAVPAISQGAVAAWCKQVLAAAALRRVTETGYALTAHGDAQADDVDNIAALLEHAQDQIAEATSWVGGSSANAKTALADHITDTLAAINERVTNGDTQGIPTGYTDFDAVTNGLHPGQLVVVAGRPGLGKSTVTVDIARSAAIKNEIPTSFLSFEMHPGELTERILAAEARVRFDDIRRGQLADEDWAGLEDAAARISDAPLHIVDSAGWTITDIRAQARKLVSRHKIKLIVIDYLQLIESQGKAENRQLEVSSFSRKLKLLAKELEVPIVVAAQLNRGPEQRLDHRPRMSDLRESGGIENDADMVVLIHRPDAAERDDPRAGEADLILAKHRSGPTATVTVAHQLHYSRFVDMARE